jgi:hypothetical protein
MIQSFSCAELQLASKSAPLLHAILLILTRSSWHGGRHGGLLLLLARPASWCGRRRGAAADGLAPGGRRWHGRKAEDVVLAVWSPWLEVQGYLEKIRSSCLKQLLEAAVLSYKSPQKSWENQWHEVNAVLTRRTVGGVPLCRISACVVV